MSNSKRNSSGSSEDNSEQIPLESPQQAKDTSQKIEQIPQIPQQIEETPPEVAENIQSAVEILFIFGWI